MDMFYRCRVSDTSGARAADDASELLWLRPEDLRPEDFGLLSIRKGITQLLQQYTNTLQPHDDAPEFLA